MRDVCTSPWIAGSSMMRPRRRALTTTECDTVILNDRRLHHRITRCHHGRRPRRPPARACIRGGAWPTWDAAAPYLRRAVRPPPGMKYHAGRSRRARHRPFPPQHLARRRTAAVDRRPATKSSVTVPMCDSLMIGGECIPFPCSMIHAVYLGGRLLLLPHVLSGPSAS